MKNSEIIVQILENLYPDAQCALHHRTPFELLIATIMSAQCTDVRVNIITETLFKDYNTPKDFAEITYEELEPMIRSCGVYKNKSRSIINTSRILLDKYSGQVPCTMEQLIQLPGVGRKTANVVLSNAFGQNAIAVDTHVFRVSARIGLTRGAKNPVQAENQLYDVFPDELIPHAHHWLILHGRYVCQARKPKCTTCGLQEVCSYYQNKALESIT